MCHFQQARGECIIAYQCALNNQLYPDNSYRDIDMLTNLIYDTRPHSHPTRNFTIKGERENDTQLQSDSSDHLLPSTNDGSMSMMRIDFYKQA